jgi:hypothetical protein
LLRNIPAKEDVIVAGDLNRSSGDDRDRFERWHGGDFGKKNKEGERILDMV